MAANPQTKPTNFGRESAKITVAMIHKSPLPSDVCRFIRLRNHGLKWSAIQMRNTGTKIHETEITLTPQHALLLLVKQYLTT